MQERNWGIGSLRRMRTNYKRNTMRNEKRLRKSSTRKNLMSSKQIRMTEIYERILVRNSFLKRITSSDIEGNRRRSFRMRAGSSSKILLFLVYLKELKKFCLNQQLISKIQTYAFRGKCGYSFSYYPTNNYQGTRIPFHRIFSKRILIIAHYRFYESQREIII